MRILSRAVLVVLFAIVVADAVSRGDESAAAGRGNVSIIHVSNVPAPEDTADAQPAEPNVSDPAEHHETPAALPTVADTEAHEAAPADRETHPAPAETTLTAPAAAAPESHGAAPVPEERGHVAAEAPVHAALAHAEAATEEGRLTPAGHADGRPEVVDDFAESGRRFWQAGDFEAAEKAFTRALTANVPIEKKRNLVLEMADLYRGANQLPKATAVLEKFIKTYANDREIPQVLLRLGAMYRELGVYTMATARFFQVLNSTLRVSDEDIPEYRKLAMKARLEIAETYAVQGNFTEAEKYFSRLQILDLEPADRERVLLRGAQMQFTLKQWLAAEKALAGFLAGSPDSPNAAEVHYMRARALDELGRKQEAVEEVLALLQMKDPGVEEAARSVAYWKRRCANELANRFYEQGDFLGALSIYQALARASMEPSWRWPAIYQIGLCFERMAMPQRAAEAYDAILSTEGATGAAPKLPESLVSLQEMAKWRRSQLVWIEDAGKQLQSLVGGKPAG